MSKEPGQRLGRGLAALLGDQRPAPTAPAAAPPAPGVTAIPVEHLEPGPFQPRGDFDPASMAELVDSIRARGILQPLLARPHPEQKERYQIIAGERRWRAAQQAGLHVVPALVRALSDAEAMAAALVENLQRQDLNAIEEAEGYHRLTEEFGLTQERLAESVGKSRSHVANMLRLRQLPATVMEEVRRGRLSAGHARALLGHPDPAKAALAVIARGLNVRQTEAMVPTHGTKARSPSVGSSTKDPETAALERDLAERLGLKVDISFDGKSGSVRIHYRSLDQLDSLIALLMPSA
ncbi:MAG: ParB/RepB/Spo0J family partition protein [Alphaproteobacteria bacterium]|nr:ParB/RepB/Spo0J family partition protein [Alphaproteobacteria bacterium]